VPPADLTERLDRFFTEQAPTARGETVVVAHSGGADSTALLEALLALAPRRGLRVLAAHLDHDLVPGSASRARAARELAERLGAECVVERRPVPELAAPGESLEAAARRVRYRFLEEVRSARSARWIATAHHRDDQAETVVLRMLQGTGLEGLAGVLPRRGRIVRPLLDLPREALHRSLDGALPAGVSVMEDPSNRDPGIARNRVRHHLLPHLSAETPGVAERLARLAGAARGARRAVEARLTEWLGPGAERPALDLDAFRALPEPLPAFALALLHRRAGAPHPAGAGARDELLRQLADAGTRASGVDAGGGWRWREREGVLVLEPPAERPVPGVVGPFSYRLPPPSTPPESRDAVRAGRRSAESRVWIGEIGATLHLRRERVAPWMFRGSRHRAALVLPEPGLDRLVVRNRRPGDRLRPLGAPGERKLKVLLIDRRVPRRERERLPLLVVDGRIAWVPGVTIDEAFRLPGRLRDEGGEVWTVEIRREGEHFDRDPEPKQRT
jgi:tRNA(Ile)-lysidine synthase